MPYFKVIVTVDALNQNAGITKTETEATHMVFATLEQRENGRVKGHELRPSYDDEVEVLTLLGKSTSYIKRSHLTSRHFNSRLTRKTLAFSKTIAMQQAASTLEDAQTSDGVCFD